ncbi:MAG: hypothetical protein POELPBGB_01058 [Bacteroidia bacterium]|nr:hypothetical protein [Bacteroidia bacterium]
MMLIAESGSTKTDWRLVEGKVNTEKYVTLGFNPFHQTSEAISLEIKSNLLSRLEKPVDTIYYYGAGCSSAAMCAVVEKALKECFPLAAVTVDHDLLAAARGLCGHEKGIAAIMGTGSNSCVFDGEKITANIPALGYILGDEGSGASIGKQFLADYIIGIVPADIAKDFHLKTGLDKEKIFEGVYMQPMPSRFLASTGKFIFEKLDNPYMYNLVKKSFTDFFDRYICRYPEHKTYPLHLTGSIAFYYSAVLKQVASEKGVTVGRIMDSPAEGLLNYHIQ